MSEYRTPSAHQVYPATFRKVRGIYIAGVIPALITCVNWFNFTEYQFFGIIVHLFGISLIAFTFFITYKSINIAKYSFKKDAPDGIYYLENLVDYFHNKTMIILACFFFVCGFIPVIRDHAIYFSFPLVFIFAFAFIFTINSEIERLGGPHFLAMVEKATGAKLFGVN